MQRLKFFLWALCGFSIRPRLKLIYLNRRDCAGCQERQGGVLIEEQQNGHPTHGPHDGNIRRCYSGDSGGVLISFLLYFGCVNTPKMIVFSSSDGDKACAALPTRCALSVEIACGPKTTRGTSRRALASASAAARVEAMPCQQSRRLSRNRSKPAKCT